MKIKTLAMIKMEKNFIAHNEKGYPRQPYEHFTIEKFLDRIEEELEEAIDAYDMLNYKALKQELADISNLVDYCFEVATKKAEENES